MIVKTHYKSKIDKNLGSNKRNILSFKSEIKNNELPIFEFGWHFIFLLIKHKLKHSIYLLVMENTHNEICIDFFYRKK